MAAWDIATIICVATIAFVFSELVSWYLVYRTEQYQKLKASIEKSNKAVEKLDAQVVAEKDKKSHKKKIDFEKAHLSEKNQQMQTLKMKSSVVNGISMITVYGFMNQMYDAVPVAKLPFLPIPLIRRITHGTIPGDDNYDCSMTFVYALCSLSIRTLVTRFFGFQPREEAPPQWGADYDKESKDQ